MHTERLLVHRSGITTQRRYDNIAQLSSSRVSAVARAAPAAAAGPPVARLPAIGGRLTTVAIQVAPPAAVAPSGRRPPPVGARPTTGRRCGAPQEVKLWDASDASLPALHTFEGHRGGHFNRLGSRISAVASFTRRPSKHRHPARFHGSAPWQQHVATHAQ